MQLSEKALQILDALDGGVISNQRQLAEHAGVSLGQVNHILKGLLEKGLVKIGNFQKNPRKVGYMYILTHKGLQTRSRLAHQVVTRKLEEYESLRARLAQRLGLFEKEERLRVAFVGPEMIKDFMASVIHDHRLNLDLDCCYEDWTGLKGAEPGSFDMVLFLDGNPDGVAGIAEATGFPRDKLVPLW